MVNFSSILPTIQQAINDKNWAWSEVALGYLDGGKAGTALSTRNHEITVMKCLGTFVETYKLYNLVRELGLFNRYPRLALPLKIGAVIIGGSNLLITFGELIGSFHGGRRKKLPGEKSPDLWNYTIQAQAIGSIVTTVLLFQKKPMQAATFFLTGAVAIAIQRNGISKISKLFDATTYIAEGNLFWNGSWPKKALISTQVIGAFLSR